MAYGSPPTATPRHRVLTLQAIYYIVTGLWPLVHFSSFELVTGPKTDDWLVRMVGLLVVLIGVTLAVAVRRDAVQTLEITVLAAGATLAFSFIDIWYALSGRISRIYLADAVLELALLAALISTSRSRPNHSKESKP
jgi:energy-converting hydrogenase Eha subunit E